MEILLFAMLLGIIPAMIASKKGYSFLSWYLYGVLLFIIALAHALLVKDKDARTCPYCAETVKAAAKICKHCHKEIGPHLEGAADYYNRDDAYRKKGPSDLAIAAHDKADATDYCKQGLAYIKEGEYDLAIQSFDKAIKLDPKNTDAYYYRGWIYTKQGK